MSYQFLQKGLITVKKGSTDEIFLIAADCGAEDVEEAGEEVLIFTKPDELSKVRDNLSGKLTINDSELTRKPIVTVSIKDKLVADRIFSLIEKLESLSEVQKVYANFDIPDDLISG